MSTMDAIIIHKFGSPDVLVEEEIDRPVPGEGEMLVQVMAASVNPVDFKIRSGLYASSRPANFPLILGRDLSGIVAAIGPGFDAFGVGDEVFVLLGRDRGSYAEYALVKPEEAAPKPANLTHVEAAAVPLAGLTAWQGIFDHGRLKAGERVLIHGGAGGVGHFAIQFAKTAGAYVITTASEADRSFLTGLGADLIIDHKRQVFDELIDVPVDLVYDLIGGDTLERSWKLLTRGGRLVSAVADPSPAKASEYGVTATRYMTQPDSKELREIGTLIEDGDVVPHIGKIFPLSDVAKAHETLEHDHIQGKIVLEAA